MSKKQDQNKAKPKNTLRGGITQAARKEQREENRARKKKNAKSNVKSNTTNNSVKANPELDGKSFNFLEFIKDKRTHHVVGVFLILFSAYLLLAFISYLKTWQADDNLVSGGLWNALRSETPAENSMGKLAAWFGYLFIKKWFGLGSFLLLLFVANTGLRALGKRWLGFGECLAISMAGAIWASVLFAFLFQKPDHQVWGGLFGFQMVDWIRSALGSFGLVVILLGSAVLYVGMVFGFAIFKRKDKNKTPTDPENNEDEKSSMVHTEITNKDIATDEPLLTHEMTGDMVIFEKEIIKDEIIPDQEHKDQVIKANDDSFELEINKVDPEIQQQDDEDSAFFTIEDTSSKPDVANNDEIPERGGLDTPYDPTLDLSSYVFPGIDLLDDHGSGQSKVTMDELESNKNRIVETLSHYDIRIQKIKATPGPTVTLYEIVPESGIRISRIKNLEDDIALSLSALGIRIIAPIPGKGTIGIEVPNINKETVSMRSMLESEKFQSSKMELPVAIGKTISNEPFIADLTKMPHLLIAGATGQGKSVGLNALITSLLYKKHPSQLKFVFVDPKKVELALYACIENHFLAKLPDEKDAIITDVTKVIATLNSLTVLMDQRYDLLKNAGTKNLIEYNAKFTARKLNPNDGHHYMPYIVLVIDEFADLIMTAGKEVELPVARIAQLARAVGIHLVIATQRPSVDVITGKIKANFPARIAFRVSSKVDSRTILDINGADQLIGRGDMLFSHGSDLMRLQCAFIDTPEIERLTDFIGSQQGYHCAFELPEPPAEQGASGKDFDSRDRDPMFEEAARIIVNTQQGSTSLLQRKLQLGHNRAGRIMDQLEAAGIVGPPLGSKPREVYFKDEGSLEQFLKNLQ